MYIYCLTDPVTGKAKYVGKTVNVYARYRKHLKEKHNAKKRSWIGDLLKQGFMPKIKVLEIVDANNWKKREAWWINYLRKKEQPLVNLSVGGEGSSTISEGKRKK